MTTLREMMEQAKARQRDCQHATVRRVAADTEGAIGGPHRPQPGSRHIEQCENCFAIMPEAGRES